MTLARPANTEKHCPLHSYQIGIAWTTVGAGGSARVFLDLAHYLPQQGVRFTGAVGSPADVAAQTGNAIESFGPDGVKGIARMISARKVMLEALKRDRPDLIASHFAFFAAPILDELKDRVHVVHFHGPWAAESQIEGAGKLSIFRKKLLEEQVYASANRVIVLSKAFAKVANEEYGVPEEILRIVPGAVDVDRFNISDTRAQAREVLNWPADRMILVSVRRLVNRMGLDRLIEAVAELREQHPEILLVLVGKGRLRAELEAMVKAQHLERHVQFQGFVSDEQLPLVYRAADLSVVPTIALEGFGLVAAESLAAGTPCLVTPIGGLPEIVSGLSTALIFRSPEVPDLIAGLRQIVSGAVTLPSAERCLEYVRQNFSVELMARRTADVYREALARP